MDNTIDISKFEKIYEANSFWIGRRAAGNYESFYLIVSDQRAVSRLMAIRIMPDDVKRIIDSNGNSKTADSLARNLSNGYLYVK
ncbi:MAG: hypothetical protein PUF60_02540 [Firmicutes bacterium]|nr:hypothetical protein [Bacillota bacterium]